MPEAWFSAIFRKYKKTPYRLSRAKLSFRARGAPKSMTKPPAYILDEIAGFSILALLWRCVPDKVEQKIQICRIMIDVYWKI